VQVKVLVGTREDGLLRTARAPAFSLPNGWTPKNRKRYEPIT
jgi:hypothetical protein